MVYGKKTKYFYDGKPQYIITGAELKKILKVETIAFGRYGLFVTYKKDKKRW